jgi:DNA-binding response OmpR family regulator
MEPLMSSQFQKINPTILVIDNDPSTSAIFERLLESNDYTALTANSGKEGLKTVQRVMLDLIILDLLMPEMDGWQLCKSIREMTRTPILIISAIESPEIITKTLDLGADDYLVKPISSYTLLAHVKNLVRRHKTEELALPENE